MRKYGVEGLIAALLIIAVVAYVILPVAVRGYQPDAAFSGILTGILGFASLLLTRGTHDAETTEKDENSQ